MVLTMIPLVCFAGAVKYLQQRFDIERWQMRGASAGALVATLAACNVNSEVAFESAHRLSMEHKLFERPLGLAGVQKWLQKSLHLTFLAPQCHAF
jgi:predicted acylesterase/phospholipase RssA